MALSITKLHSWVNTGKGNTVEGFVNIDINDTDYAAGGWSVTADNLSDGASTVYAFNLPPVHHVDAGTTAGVVLSYDYDTNKITAWIGAGADAGLEELSASAYGNDVLGDAVIRVHYICY